MKVLWPRVLGLLALIASVAACNGATASKLGERPAASGPTTTAEPAQAKPKVQGTPQPKLPIGTVVLETPPREPVTLRVEVASTDAQRQMGLMFRESLGADEGMLFLFPTERRNSFWMHNTLIPLDLLFIDSEWKVVGVVEQAEPMTDDPRAVPKMSQYVLEVNGGFAARHGLGPDTQVRYTPPAGMNP
jgi:uncharacterized membrane protein (UPF0127 family)